ncbi:MAG: DUF6734 family protein [Saonia sp.]
MKFIQSFWSKPIFDTHHMNNWNFRHHGGFPTSFLFYCSWIYSCLSIQKQYPNLHLVTDDLGIEIFKNTLNLPYVSFSNELNDLREYHEGLWALGKLYTYRLQKEAFCHIDGDVFLFGPVLDPILDQPIFCQSFDRNKNQYSEVHPYVRKHFNKVPAEFNADLSDKIKYINAGVIGGNNIDLFQLYTSKAFELITNNMDKLEDINSSLFNLYYEQFLISNIISEKNLAVASLYTKSNDNNAYNFAAFHQIPQQSRYVHLISHLKRSTEFMEQVVARLQLEYPEYYSRLTHFYTKGKL